MRVLYPTIKLLILLVFLYPVHAKADEIMQMCQEKWGHNYEMILYCIKNQREAKKAIDNTIKDDISIFCEKKWGNNFEMVEYCIKNQRDAKQKINSESSKSGRSLEELNRCRKILAEGLKFSEIEDKALDKKDYCAAWKACSEQVELIFNYQIYCTESEKETIKTKEMLRESEVRRGSLYDKCAVVEGQRMEKELKNLEQGKKKSERSSTTKKNAIAPQVLKRGFTDPTTGMEFIFVKGGCFQMGDNFGEGRDDEKPVHEVCVSDFYLGKNEVTVGQFRKFVRENDYHTDAEKGNSCWVSNGSSVEKRSGASWLSPGFNQEDNNPVTCISWNDATAFYEWLLRVSGKKYRLPTEAEWEYAARSGGKKERYAGTSSPVDLKNYGWFDANSGNRTHPVGKKRPNGLGLYDMSGNVSEWCQDGYKKGYYSDSPRNNPQGSESGIYRMKRGGSWYDSLITTRVAFRGILNPTDCSNTYGFRLTISAP